MNTDPTTPQPAAAAPSCPDFVEGEAREEWARVTATRSIAEVDRATLTAYVIAWARVRQAETELKKTGGEVVKSPTGYPINNPWLAISRSAAQQMNTAAAALGFTPASRDETTKTPTPQTLPARASSSPDPRDFIRLVATGATEAEICAAITAAHPNANPRAVLRQTMKLIADNAKASPEIVLAWSFEAAREIHRRAMETGDLPAALKALSEINKTAAAMAKLQPPRKD